MAMIIEMASVVSLLIIYTIKHKNPYTGSNVLPV